MEWNEGKWELGVLACCRVREEGQSRRNTALEEIEKGKVSKSLALVKRGTEILREVERPLWQRISELDPKNELSLRPMLRRDRIRKLLRAVDAMLRAELKTPVAAETASSAERADVAAVVKERSVFWDPLPETCFYLEISQSRLAQYSRQLTGLGARDLVDRIRVEQLRVLVREKLRRAAEVAQKYTELDFRKMNAQDGTRVLLKAARGEGLLNRQELALEIGLASKQRLYRAVLACEGITLEQLEREEAEGIFLALTPSAESGESPERESRESGVGSLESGNPNVEKEDEITT